MKGIFATLLCAGLLPAAASAADFDYTYVGLAYSDASSGARSQDYGKANGERLDGSYGLGQHWFIEGSLQQDSFDFSGTGGFYGSSQSGITLTRGQLGGGFHTAITDGLDFVTHLNYGRAKTVDDPPDSPSSAVEDEGYIVGAGLRFQAAPNLELDAGIDHDDLAYGDVCPSPGFICEFYPTPSQAGVENVLYGAARFSFGAVGVGLEYRASSFQSWRDWLISVRWNF